MLNLAALRKVLAAVLSSRLHTAILFTPSGDLVAHATHACSRPKDQLRVLVGLASEVWLEVNDESLGMVESELGKILVFPLYHRPSSSDSRPDRSSLYSRSTDSVTAAHNSPEGDPPFLIALNALDDVEWAEMQIKAQGVANHLAGPLTELRDRLLPSPPRARITERFY